MVAIESSFRGTLIGAIGSLGGALGVILGASLLGVSVYSLLVAATIAAAGGTRHCGRRLTVAAQPDQPFDPAPRTGH